MASKALAKATSLLPIPLSEFQDAMKGIVAPGEKLDVFSLPIVKIPAGGGRNWELPDGTSVAELTGVIVVRQPVHAYWATEFTGGGSPPDCVAIDNVTGIGTPGGLCARCLLNEFGSGKDNAKACRQITRLFMLLEGEWLPTFVQLPPSAFRICQGYNFTVGKVPRRALWHVRTGISLTQTKSGSGIVYSVPSFRLIEELSEDQRQEANDYRSAWLPVVNAMAVREEV